MSEISFCTPIRFAEPNTFLKKVANFEEAYWDVGHRRVTIIDTRYELEEGERPTLSLAALAISCMTVVIPIFMFLAKIVVRGLLPNYRLAEPVLPPPITPVPSVAVALPVQPREEIPMIELLNARLGALFLQFPRISADELERQTGEIREELDRIPMGVGANCRQLSETFGFLERLKDQISEKREEEAKPILKRFEELKGKRGALTDEQEKELLDEMLKEYEGTKLHETATRVITRLKIDIDVQRVFNGLENNAACDQPEEPPFTTVQADDEIKALSDEVGISIGPNDLSWSWKYTRDIIADKRKREAEQLELEREGEDSYVIIRRWISESTRDLNSITTDKMEAQFAQIQATFDQFAGSEAQIAKLRDSIEGLKERIAEKKYPSTALIVKMCRKTPQFYSLVRGCQKGMVDMPDGFRPALLVEELMMSEAPDLSKMLEWICTVLDVHDVCSGPDFSSLGEDSKPFGYFMMKHEISSFTVLEGNMTLPVGAIEVRVSSRMKVPPLKQFGWVVPGMVRHELASCVECFAHLIGDEDE